MENKYNFHFKINLQKEIGLEINKIRKKRGVKTQELSRKINISQQQISNYENGKSSISFFMLLNILSYFNVNPIEFILSINCLKENQDDKFKESGLINEKEVYSCIRKNDFFVNQVIMQCK